MAHADSFDPSSYDVILFDLDGVLTSTAKIHASCWKGTFDEYLKKRADELGEEFVPFDEVDDYGPHVDGKPRYDGVRDFLASRGIKLPEGTPDSPAGEESVCGIGNRKQICVEAAIESGRVEAYPGSIEWLKWLATQDVRLACVSSSKNAEAVLAAAGISDYFETRVDGVVAAETGLPGKPAPDTFLEAARRLGADAKRAVVVEDAIAGVQAGRNGDFGLVIGVSRKDDAEELAENGADIVVHDLGELLP